MSKPTESEQKIIARLSPIFREILEVPAFAEDLSMTEVDTWDSLAHIRLLAAIEEAFGIEIPFEEAVEMTTGDATLKKIAKYVRLI